MHPVSIIKDFIWKLTFFYDLLNDLGFKFKRKKNTTFLRHIVKLKLEGWIKNDASYFTGCFKTFFLLQGDIFDLLKIMNKNCNL